MSWISSGQHLQGTLQAEARLSDSRDDFPHVVARVITFDIIDRDVLQRFEAELEEAISPRAKRIDEVSLELTGANSRRGRSGRGRPAWDATLANERRCRPMARHAIALSPTNGSSRSWRTSKRIVTTNSHRSSFRFLLSAALIWSESRRVPATARSELQPVARSIAFSRVSQIAWCADNRSQFRARDYF